MKNISFYMVIGCDNKTNHPLNLFPIVADYNAGELKEETLSSLIKNYYDRMHDFSTKNFLDSEGKELLPQPPFKEVKIDMIGRTAEVYFTTDKIIKITWEFHSLQIP